VLSVSYELSPENVLYNILTYTYMIYDLMKFYSFSGCPEIGTWELYVAQS
jgi:hypothetical protein